MIIPDDLDTDTRLLVQAAGRHLATAADALGEDIAQVAAERQSQPGGWRLEIHHPGDGPNTWRQRRVRFDDEELGLVISIARSILSTHVMEPPTTRLGEETYTAYAALDRLADLTPEAVEGRTMQAMTEARAGGATWAEIGQAWGGRPRQAAEGWYRRRARRLGEG